ncbi:hypothetical protein B0I21_103342 [Sphingobacterium paludis]|uniref:Uncharacterized protein n=1 Tax=Sphingobacterium paludis TaxID=1476465 RepID=A0A4R7D3F7_9SPHI|nr:hypothetical protein B0I21_103342 [Sphingobacterium paludis]
MLSAFDSIVVGDLQHYLFLFVLYKAIHKHFFTLCNTQDSRALVPPSRNGEND